MEIEGPVLEPQQPGGDDLPIVGQHEKLGFEGEQGLDRRCVAQPGRREDLIDAQFLGDAMDHRRRRSLVATGRAGRRRDDGDQAHVVVAAEPAQALTPERAAPQEDGPHARAAGSPVGHARALVASRTSASSSFEAPTAISSSIDSR